jgi:CubicO group peptidase (beta-lactamase class C family)
MVHLATLESSRVHHTIGVLLAIASITFSSLGHAEEAPPRHADIVAGDTAHSLDSALVSAAKHGFGGAVFVEGKGVPILKAGYGYANRDKKIAFTAETIGQIGSITKPMTALAILELAREGKLDIEKPVKTYLPDAAEPAASATLHRLLTHHAGLMDYCGEDFDALTKADLLAKCMAKPLDHPIGEDHYSNMGFSILAAVIEAVSGNSWELYLRERIWAPLEMHRTGFAQFGDAKHADFAVGYLNDKPQGVISDEIAKLHCADWNLKGNGGVQSTATDMERFWRGLTARLPGISPDVVRDMITPHDPIEGEAWEGYGLAVRLDSAGKPYRIGHSGSDGTFFAYFGWLPQQDIFIYVVGNNGQDDVKPIVSTVLKAALAMAEEQKAAPATPR